MSSSVLKPSSLPPTPEQREAATKVSLAKAKKNAKMAKIASPNKSPNKSSSIPSSSSPLISKLLVPPKKIAKLPKPPVPAAPAVPKAPSNVADIKVQDLTQDLNKKIQILRDQCRVIEIREKQALEQVKRAEEECERLRASEVQENISDTEVKNITWKAESEKIANKLKQLQILLEKETNRANDATHRMTELEEELEEVTDRVASPSPPTAAAAVRGATREFQQLQLEELRAAADQARVEKEAETKRAASLVSQLEHVSMLLQAQKDIVAASSASLSSVLESNVQLKSKVAAFMLRKIDGRRKHRKRALAKLVITEHGFELV